MNVQQGQLGGRRTSLNADGDAVSVPPLINALPSILGSVGTLWGFYYSFSKDKGFWSYVGFGLLGSIAGGTVGTIIKTVAYPSNVRVVSEKEVKTVTTTTKK